MCSHEQELDLTEHANARPLGGDWKESYWPEDVPHAQELARFISELSHVESSDINSVFGYHHDSCLAGTVSTVKHMLDEAILLILVVNNRIQQDVFS